MTIAHWQVLLFYSLAPPSPPPAPSNSRKQPVPSAGRQFHQRLNTGWPLRPRPCPCQPTRQQEATQQQDDGGHAGQAQRQAPALVPLVGAIHWGGRWGRSASRE